MANKVAWGKQLTEEQFFLQSAPYSDDKKFSLDPLMILLDYVDGDGYLDVYCVIPLKDRGVLEFYKERDNSDVPFLICHPVNVPWEFRGTGICANA